MVDLRFVSTLQALLNLALALREGISQMSSSELAEGLAANPSHVRKLVAPLVQAGLLVSTQGKNGGVALARSPSEISLAEIYRATAPEKRMLTARQVPHQCVVSRNFEPYLDHLSATMEAAVFAELGSQTLADALSDLDARDRRARRRLLPSRAATH